MLFDVSYFISAYTYAFKKMLIVPTVEVTLTVRRIVCPLHF